MAGGVGPTSHFCEKRCPLVTRPSAALPIGTRIFAAMVEELLILALEWCDLPGDERVEIGELCRTSAGIAKSMRPARRTSTRAGDDAPARITVLVELPESSRRRVRPASAIWQAEASAR
jgi:hypothetical protein